LGSSRIRQATVATHPEAVATNPPAQMIRRDC
jgi:hypothetical protein